MVTRFTGQDEATADAGCGQRLALPVDFSDGELFSRDIGICGLKATVRALVLTKIGYVEGRIEAYDPAEILPRQALSGLGHILQETSVIRKKDRREIIDLETGQIDS